MVKVHRPKSNFLHEHVDYRALHCDNIILTVFAMAFCSIHDKHPCNTVIFQQRRLTDLVITCHT